MASYDTHPCAFLRSSGCISTFIHDNSNLPAFIRDSKSLRDIHKSLLSNSDLYCGIIMRFVRNSTTFLGEEYDAVSIHITYYQGNHVYFQTIT